MAIQLIENLELRQTIRAKLNAVIERVNYINLTPSDGIEIPYDATGNPALDRANSGLQLFTAAADTALTVNMLEGASMTLHLIDGDAHVITWPDTQKVGIGEPASYTALEIFTFWKVGSTVYRAYVGSGV